MLLITGLFLGVLMVVAGLSGYRVYNAQFPFASRLPLRIPVAFWAVWLGVVGMFYFLGVPDSFLQACYGSADYFTDLRFWRDIRKITLLGAFIFVVALGGNFLVHRYDRNVFGVPYDPGGTGKMGKK